MFGLISSSSNGPGEQPGSRSLALIVLALAALLIALGNAGAERAEAGETRFAAASTKSAPKIRLEQSPEFYGSFYKGERFDRKIKVHNDGDAPLNLLRITPKCSCATIGNYPKVIMPGESGEVEVAIDTDRIATGNQEKLINLITDDPVSPRTIYYFRVTNKASFAQPRTVVSRGGSEPASKPATSRPRSQPSRPSKYRDGIELRGLYGEEKRAVIELKSAGTAFQVKEIKSADGRFRVDGFESAPSGRLCVVRLSATAIPEPQKTQGKLQVVADFQGRTVYWEAPVAIDHHHYVWLDPGTTIRLVNKDTDPLLQEGAAPIVKGFRARAAEGLTFNITGTRFEGIPDGIFEVEVEPVEEGRDYTIRVILREYAKKSFVRGKLLIDTDEARVGSLEISIQAIFGKRRR